MRSPNRFDPFRNRLCRNVRNALSESFKTVLETNQMAPAHRTAGFFLADALPGHVRAYIDNRLAAYEKVCAEIANRRLEHPLDIAVIIWNHRLFFETHEYLETFWINAKGEEKTVFQAMIRAAGTYVHLEQDNYAAARRIAGKALPVLKKQQHLLSAHMDAPLLLHKLETLDPLAPVLSKESA